MSLGAVHTKITRYEIANQADLFSPPQECALILGAKLYVIQSPNGHMGLNGFEPQFMAQVNQHLSEPLNSLTGNRTGRFQQFLVGNNG
jgi:hypothetical protein